MNGPTESVGAKDHISDPFDVVTDHHKRQNTNTTGSSTLKPDPISASEGDSSTSSQTERFSEPAANLFTMPVSTLISAYPISDISVVSTDTFGNSKPTLYNKSHDADKESLKFPIRHNLHENGLQWSMFKITKVKGRYKKAQIPHYFWYCGVNQG